jgi:hypothetical protein
VKSNGFDLRVLSGAAASIDLDGFVALAVVDPVSDDPHGRGGLLPILKAGDDPRAVENFGRRDLTVPWAEARLRLRPEFSSASWLFEI